VARHASELDWQYEPTVPDPGEELSPLVRYARTIEAKNYDPLFRQNAFALQNTNRSFVTGTGDVNVILRQEVEQYEDRADQNLTATYKLQRQVGAAGGWVDVTASSTYAKVRDSTYNTDGAAVTTNRITGSTPTPAASSYTFLNGEYDEGDGTLDSITWTNDVFEHTELVWSLQIIDTDFSAGEYIEFRIVESGGTVLDAYAAYARYTCNAAPVTNSYSTDFWEEMTDAEDTVSGTTPTVIDAMTITPGAGTYLVMFSGAVNTETSETLTCAIYENGSEVSLSGPIYYTRTQFAGEASHDNHDDKWQMACVGIATVGASQAIDVRWWSSGSSVTWDMHSRRLILVKVEGTGISAGAAGSNSVSTSTTDFSASAASISSPPGDAGDYLVLFKCSPVGHATVVVGAEFRLYVGGTAEDSDHFRLFEHELSYLATEFPHFQACIVNVGASEAVDMRYARVGGTSETITVDDVGLVMYGPFDASDWAQDNAQTQDANAISGSYVAVDRDDTTTDMSVSLSAADDYIAVFNEVMDLSTGVAVGLARLRWAFHVNGTEDESTYAVKSWEESWAAAQQTSYWAFGQISPGASQSVDIRVYGVDQTSGFNLQHQERTLLMFRPSTYAGVSPLTGGYCGFIPIN
jgi:hypothetical protein